MTLKRLLKAMALPLLLLCISLHSFAQTKVITGKVTDSKDGSPVVGATVAAKGSNRGTTTGTDGGFSISVPESVRTLTISYVGYGSEDVSIAGKTSVDVQLTASNNNLNEVVVVGYGTARRRDLTGSVQSIKEKDFNKGVITSPDQLIQGKAAGVLVINNTGQPGGSTTIRIRGTSSIRSGNQPLFVIDGVPLSGGSARPGGNGGDFGSDAGNPLNFINPNDIANIEILKDASATAIYGSRGANGVVLITTKRGISGAPYLDVNAASGFSNVAKKLKVLSGDEYRKALTDYGAPASNDFGKSVNAFDEITRSGIIQNYNIAYGGGNENARYRFSAGYLDQEGVIKTSELKKLTASLTSSFKFLESRRLGLDFNVLVTQNREDIAPISNFVGFTGNVISQALQWNPTLDLRNTDGSIHSVGGTTINPLASLEYYKDKANVNTVIASISPSYKILKELEYKFLFSVQKQTGVRKGMVNRLLNAQDIENRGVAFITDQDETNTQVTNTLNYGKQVTSALHLDAVVGYEWLTFDDQGNGVLARDFNNVGLNYYDYLQYSTQTSRQVFSFISPTTELQSYFGRVALNYRDRYGFQASFRADGSTRFGTNNKYGYFPAISGSWTITNESFLENNNIFNNLKLRVGWGKTGNQEFPSGSSRNQFVVTGTGVFSQTYFGNPDLKWETSATTNVGLDFSILNNRVNGSIDYFYKKTTDVLFDRTLALPAPSGKIWVNLDGYVLNKGVEISIFGGIIRQQDLSWNIGVNASFLTNTVSGLTGFYETGDLRGQGFSDVRGQRVVSGQPVNVWYLGVFEGIDKATGQSIYTGGDPAANKFYVGSPNPKFLLGVSTDVTYKKFTATINMNGTFGHYLFNNTAASVLGIGNLLSGRNIAHTIIEEPVKEATSNAPAPSTRNLEKGNYVKMANATLSYRIGNVGPLRNLAISLTGQNLFVITNYTGFDPEVNTDAGVGGIPSLGVEYIPYPSARTILLGVNFSL